MDQTTQIVPISGLFKQYKNESFGSALLENGFEDNFDRLLPVIYGYV